MMSDPGDLDIPPFLRHHPAARRRVRSNVAATAMD
jgi:hypothetical protein